jgi:hypothetical protein
MRVTVDAGVARVTLGTPAEFARCSADDGPERFVGRVRYDERVRVARKALRLARLVAIW